MDYLQSQLGRDRTVLVHCSAGKDRTGLLLSYYLALENRIAPETAIARVRQAQFDALSAPGWEELAVRVIRTLLDGKS